MVVANHFSRVPNHQYNPAFIRANDLKQATPCDSCLTCWSPRAWAAPPPPPRQLHRTVGRQGVLLKAACRQQKAKRQKQYVACASTYSRNTPPILTPSQRSAVEREAKTARHPLAPVLMVGTGQHSTNQGRKQHMFDHGCSSLPTREIRVRCLAQGMDGATKPTQNPIESTNYSKEIYNRYFQIAGAIDQDS